MVVLYFLAIRFKVKYLIRTNRFEVSRAMTMRIVDFWISTTLQRVFFRLYSS